MTNPKPRNCLTINELSVGMTFKQPYQISESDVQKFGEISGDFNPAHFNEAYASQTRFKTRIAHGMISVAKFSGIFGMDMPGLGAIWGSQNVKFLAPVYMNKPYTAVAECTKVTDKFAVFSTYCVDAEGNRVLEGEGVLFPIPEKVKADMAGELPGLLAMEDAAE